MIHQIGPVRQQFSSPQLAAKRRAKIQEIHERPERRAMIIPNKAAYSTRSWKYSSFQSQVSTSLAVIFPVGREEERLSRALTLERDF